MKARATVQDDLDLDPQEAERVAALTRELRAISPVDVELLLAVALRRTVGDVMRVSVRTSMLSDSKIQKSVGVTRTAQEAMDLLRVSAERRQLISWAKAIAYHIAQRRGSVTTADVRAIMNRFGLLWNRTISLHWLGSAFNDGARSFLKKRSVGDGGDTRDIEVVDPQRGTVTHKRPVQVWVLRTGVGSRRPPDPPPFRHPDGRVTRWRSKEPE